MIRKIPNLDEIDEPNSGGIQRLFDTHDTFMNIVLSIQTGTFITGVKYYTTLELKQDLKDLHEMKQKGNNNGTN